MQYCDADVFHKLTRYRDYISGEPLSYWWVASGFEVDFSIGDHTAREVKAGEHFGLQDVQSLRALVKGKKLKRHICVRLKPRQRMINGVTVLPVSECLGALWAGKFE